MSRLLPLLACLLASCPATTVDPDLVGVDPSLRADLTEARAGVVRSDPEGERALFGGVNAEGRAGDIKLYNSEVQFIIQGPYRSHGMIDTGGGIIDMDLVRGDTSLGRDLVEDNFLAFGLSRLFHADTVQIIADGSDGGDAVVEARGTDVTWDYFTGVFERSEPVIADLGLQITQTYRLAPGSRSLTVTTTLTNAGDSSSTFTLEDGLFMSGEDALPWAVGKGFDTPTAGLVPAVVFSGRSGEATVSMWPAEGDYTISAFSAVASDLGILLTEHPEQTLQPGGQVTVERHVAIARDTITAEAERLESGDLGEVRGEVRDPSGGVAGVRVHFIDDAGADAGFALTSADGSFTARLPTGAWTAYAVAHEDLEHVDLPDSAGRYGPYSAASVNEAQLSALRGQSHPAPLPFALGRTTPAGATLDVTTTGTADLVIEVDPASAIEVTVVNDRGIALPAVIDVSWASGEEPTTDVPDELVAPLRMARDRRAAWAWTADGTTTVPVLPGVYDITVHHSWRHASQSVERVRVSAGQTRAVSITLNEVVPRDGWLALDPHLHAAPSFDGALPMEDRLITCAATGVELPVPTDHDAMGDYRPLASALGLDGRMSIVPGLEVTSWVRGHFNLYPVEPAPLSEINGGALPWWYTPRDTEELFDRMRDKVKPEGLIQVNHPRVGGMFGAGRYNPSTGEPSLEDHFSWRFEAFELYNGGLSEADAMRSDWFSFLNQGIIRTPTGSSDSHYRYIPCGMARTDVYLGQDDPSGIDPSRVRQALVAGHVVVASGTTLRASVSTHRGTYLPGDTLTGDNLELEATVASPDWIQPGTLRLYRNGEVIQTQELGERDRNGLWFDGSWPLSGDSDAWYVIEVQGTQSQGAAWRDTTPYAITNAFFHDVDGDGWTAPGLP